MMGKRALFRALWVLMALTWTSRVEAAQALGLLDGVFLSGAATREPFRFETGTWTDCENVFFGSNMVRFCTVQGEAFTVNGRDGEDAPTVEIQGVKISMRSWQRRIIREYVFSGRWSEVTTAGQSLQSTVTIVLWRFTDDPPDTYKGSLSLDDVNMSQPLQAWRIIELGAPPR